MSSKQRYSLLFVNRRESHNKSTYVNNLKNDLKILQCILHDEKLQSSAKPIDSSGAEWLGAGSLGAQSRRKVLDAFKAGLPARRLTFEPYATP